MVRQVHPLHRGRAGHCIFLSEDMEGPPWSRFQLQLPSSLVFAMPPHPRVSEITRCSRQRKTLLWKNGAKVCEEENPVMADRKPLAVCPCHPCRAQLSGLCSHNAAGFSGTRHQPARVACNDNSNTILRLWAYFSQLLMTRSSPNCPDPTFKACKCANCICTWNTAERQKEMLGQALMWSPSDTMHKVVCPDALSEHGSIAWPWLLADVVGWKPEELWLCLRFYSEMSLSIPLHHISYDVIEKFFPIRLFFGLNLTHKILQLQFLFHVLLLTFLLSSYSLKNTKYSR